MILDNEKAKMNSQELIYELNGELVNDFGKIMGSMKNLTAEIDPLL